MPVCIKCQSQFEITPDDRELLEKLTPAIGTMKFPIPDPKFCPDCRSQRRLSFRNERSLYYRQCDLCQKKIMSMYQPDKQPDGNKYPVYCLDCFWSDKWSGEDYAMDVDLNKPFMEQLDLMHKQVPRIALSVGVTNENCDYNNYMQFCKDCYLSFVTYYSENVLYSYWVHNSKDSIDCGFCNRCELCKHCLDCSLCYDCLSVLNSENSDNCFFSSNLSGCSYCFLCTGLVKKQYYILNKPYSKQEYEAEIQKYNFGSYSDFDKARKRLITELLPARIVRNVRQVNCENCTGDQLVNCSNCYNCYDTFDSQDCRYSNIGGGGKDSMDTIGGEFEFCYDSVNVGSASRNLFWSFMVVSSNDIYYSNQCYNSSDLFGCISLRHKQCYILNKHYEKEKHKELTQKLIQNMESNSEWGEFPESLSPFGYNETSAADHFDLDKKTALELNFHWSDYEHPAPKVEKIIPKEKMDVIGDISKVPDEILKWAIECEITGKLFRIIPQELKFYRKNNLPIPRRCPDQRYKERFSLRNPRHLWDRQCQKCGVDVKTAYSEKRQETVYCEKCYLGAIY
ncbi:MAG: hypothetical protein NTZ80_01050 [Patescibacteria group bacterium]|nr:hypothetical protein [Patescibacteria group bacterium]